jgi:hypothetical protein
VERRIKQKERGVNEIRVKEREAEEAVTPSFHSNDTIPRRAITLSRSFLDPLASVYAKEKDKREKKKQRQHR